MKPDLYLEEDLFSEDKNSDTKGVISEYFNVIPIDLEWALNDRHYVIPCPQLRASLRIAKIFKRTYPTANALNWASALRKYIINPSETYFTDLSHIKNYWQGYMFYNNFLRPCSGFKEFSGQIFGSKEKFDIEYAFLTKAHNIDPYLMCMVSPKKHIDREYRCVFINGEYVSGSRYMVNMELDEDGFVPKNVIEFAKTVASEDFFLNVFEFVIDVAVMQPGLEENLSLVEVNSFECSSFYKSNLDLIYKTLTETCSSSQ